MGISFGTQEGFTFRAGVYLEKLYSFETEVYKASEEAYEAAEDGKLNFGLSMKITSISVDYAVMEKTKKIKVVQSLFSWSDMRSFESIYTYLKKKGTLCIEMEIWPSA